MADGARKLGRPMAIDDRHFSLLIHTEHPPDQVDPVRLASVMRRACPPEVRAWVEAHHVTAADGPVVVTENAELGLDNRVCAPIRCLGHLLGFLWVTDRDESMTATDLEQLAAIADAAGTVLHRELVTRDLERARERELLRELLLGGERAGPAIAELAARGRYTADGPAVAIVLSLPPIADAAAAESARFGIDAALMRARRLLGPGQAVHLLRDDHAVFAAASSDQLRRHHGPEGFAERLRRETADTLGPSPRTIAVGGTVDHLAAIAGSYRQARQASLLAETLPRFGTVVSWDRLGVYQQLLALGAHDLPTSSQHEGVRALLDDPRNEVLIATVERYLGNAGDIQRTAAELFVHRTTLYHRLRRAERITGLDLNTGDDRLTLHLGLKIAGLRSAPRADAGRR